jgi:hypothetical protein
MTHETLRIYDFKFAAQSMKHSVYMTSSSLLRLISVLLEAILRPTTHGEAVSYFDQSKGGIRCALLFYCTLIISIHINFMFSHIYAFRFDPGHLQI